MLELERVQVDAAHGRAIAGRCGILIWRGDMTPELWRANEAMMSAREAREPGKYAWINVVETTSPVPDANLRQVVAESAKGRGDRTAIIAVVQEGTGLRATMVRSVVTAMALVGPASFRPEIFKTVEDASRVVAERLTGHGYPTNAADLVQAVADLRAQIPPHSSLRR